MPIILVVKQTKTLQNIYNTIGQINTLFILNRVCKTKTSPMRVVA